MRLKLATRGSDLARTQAATVAAALQSIGCEVELVIVKTAGDRSQAASFGAIGPQGVFVREIEQALLDERADIAVHSCKDLPTSSPEALVIAAVPERADTADVLIANPAAVEERDWLKLEHGARIGTASARRQAWLKHFRPDLDIAPLRGNVPTRLERLAQGRFDAILLAAAGLERLQAGGPLAELDGFVVERLDPERFVPAPSQGALAVQCRRDRAELVTVLAALDHAPSHACVDVERAALARAEGGCDTAFGAFCAAAGGQFTLDAMIERDGEMLSARVAASEPGRLAPEAFAAFDSQRA